MTRYCYLRVHLYVCAMCSVPEKDFLSTQGREAPQLESPFDSGTLPLRETGSRVSSRPSERGR